MFRDKGPIAWRQDSSRLIGRKMMRQIASSPAMRLMKYNAPKLERRTPSSMLLMLLYRWIISGYIDRGYREGLRAMARSGPQHAQANMAELSPQTGPLSRTD
jgi:hypothetical protein